MSPERVAGLILRWARGYTRHLPPDVAERRVAELRSDLHEHMTEERAAGRPDGRIARDLAGRALRGLADDISWRRQEIARQNTDRRESRHMSRRAALLIVAATCAVLLVPAIGMLSGGGVDWGVADYVLAAVLVAGAGVVIERVLRRPSALALRLGLPAAGVAAMIAGELDDAPGLVAFGLLLVLVSLALTARTMRRRTTDG